MSLIKDLNEATSLTERESDIRDYFLNHPEHIASMSCRELGEATYTSAATVSRFCKKFGCDGYPEFKIRFLSDVKGGQIPNKTDSVQLSERENMVTLLQKVSDVQDQALEATRKALSLSQLLRIQRLLLDHPISISMPMTPIFSWPGTPAACSSTRARRRQPIQRRISKSSARCLPSRAIWPS